MTEYVPPAWGHAGTNVCGMSLEVIKGGVVMETLALPIDSKKSFVVAGRMDPLCDLVLQHPSISRTHAVFQFDANGALFLRDLQSTHGTFVNKQRIVSMEFKRLNVGDVVAFGDSTRLYAVCGLEPAPLPSRSSTSPQRQRQRQRQRQPQHRAPRDGDGNAEGDGDGISWGFREDAEEEEDDDSDDDNDDNDDNGNSNATKLPAYLRELEQEAAGPNVFTSRIHQNQVKTPKDVVQFDKIQQKMRKLQHLRRETSRILQKRANHLMELSENQQKQVERNETRAQELQQQLEQMENAFLARQQSIVDNARRREQHASKTITDRSRNRPQEDEDLASDDDEFYDRTRCNNNNKTGQPNATSGGSSRGTPGANKTTLTADMIECNVQRLEREMDALRHEERVHLQQQQQQQSREEQQEEEDEEDELDAFIQTTRSQLETEWKQNHARKMTSLQQELATQKQLLQLARPALDHVNQQHQTNQSGAESQRPVAIKAAVEATADTAPASASIPPDQEEQAEQEQSANADANASRKRKVIAQPPPQREVVSSPDEDRKPKTHTNPTKRTKSATAKNNATTGKSSHHHVPVSKKQDPHVLEGGDRVWLPPKNQTGDGRTALNDKFGY